VFWGRNLREKTTWKTHPKWDDIKMDLQDVGWGRMDWINLAQDKNRWRALLNVVMNFRVP
jgi:hypothetical protein